MKDRGKPRWPGVMGCFFATFLLAGTGAAYVLSYANERSQISRGISNCHQIVFALRMYASDHDGKYPDASLTNPEYSNDVFRVLFKEGTVKNEYIFGCAMSPFRPDGDYGSRPDFKEALEEGENHWAMTAGLGASMAADIPLVYENASFLSKWPPTWNSKSDGKKFGGRTWGNGVIVGLNDGSVSHQPVQFQGARHTGLAKGKDNKDLFEAAVTPPGSPKLKVLDVFR
ncbi:MAG TPA: hypothetical protein VLE43_15675 [Candidatus Saccharimonadia bacterium]|nr:hypothetical protein [Candidatus Saccharimonadia bacterium]